MAEARTHPYKVFVSHGSDDLWVAAQISKELRYLDVSPFLDQTDIPLGTPDFQKVIHNEISLADELIALFTPWSALRSWVWIEIGAAWWRKIPILAVFTASSPPPTFRIATAVSRCWRPCSVCFPFSGNCSPTAPIRGRSFIGPIAHPTSPAPRRNRQGTMSGTILRRRDRTARPPRVEHYSSAVNTQVRTQQGIGTPTPTRCPPKRSRAS